MSWHYSQWFWRLQKFRNRTLHQDLVKAKQDIDTVLNDALTKWEITKEKFNSMCTKGEGPGKFYQLFKVHKTHNPTDLPQGSKFY
jgi:hypothetical protein